MAERGHVPEVTVWADAARAPIVAQVLDVMGAEVKPIGVGGPRGAEVDALGKRLDVAATDDLRKLIVDRPAAFLLLASMSDVGGEDLLAAHAAGSLILAMEPPAADLLDLRTLRPKGEIPRILFLPGFRFGPGFIRAADPSDALAPPRALAIESVGRTGEGSLFARLYDAWSTVLGFVSLPESIDASLSAVGLKEVPDDPRKLTGRLAAHARIADGGSAIVQISDTASDHRRYLHILGTEAELRVTDLNYELRQITGGVVDRGEVTVGGIGFIDLVAHQWRRFLARPDLVKPDVPPHRDEQALACCLACLLSARTGQPESPRKLIEMNK